MANDKVTKALGEKYSFSIKNTSGATAVIALLAAMFDTFNLVLTEGAPNTFVYSQNNPAAIVAAGFTCDAVLDDGTIMTGVVATAGNSKRSIRQFRDFVRENPRICIDMTIQATIPAQFNQTMEVIKYTPLIGYFHEELDLNSFKSVDQFSTDKIEIKGVNLEMAYDSLLLLPVPDGCTTTISYKFS